MENFKVFDKSIDNDKLSIIIDFRPNNIIRIALTPLYTSFEDIYLISKRLINIVNEEEYKQKITQWKE